MLELAACAAAFLALGALWGPGIHLDLALRVLGGHRDGIPPERRRLLEGHAHDFLYGTIAADVVTFKSYGGARGACHQWSVIARLEERAASAAEHAFVLGYGAHLAADTVSHNHFVPYHLLRHPRYGALGHLFWELCADQDADPAVWTWIVRLQRAKRLHAHDGLIGEAVPKRVFSMGVNKKIFNHVVLAAGKRRWREGMALVRRRAGAALPHSRLARFRREALRRVRLFLAEGAAGELAAFDPSGKHALKEAARARRRLRRLLAGRSLEHEAAELARLFLP